MAADHRRPGNSRDYPLPVFAGYDLERNNAPGNGKELFMVSLKNKAPAVPGR